MKQDRLLNDTQEQVIIFPSDRRIEISSAQLFRAYGLFDTQTGVQVTDFVKGTDGKVVFKNLVPTRHYDVGAVEYIDDEKPQFAIAWNEITQDDTEEILNNFINLPVAYPSDYIIIDKGNNDVFDLADSQGERVGQVMKLSDDKPQIVHIWSMRMKDDK